MAASRRHRWKVLTAGVVGNAAFSITFSGIPTTAVLMRSGYRLDNATLGLVLGLMALGIAVSELPWGLLTDRWGDRPVLLAGLGGTGLALAALAIWAAPDGQHIPGLPLLGAGLLLVGLLGGSVNGASGRAILSWFDASERGFAMSIRQTAIPLGGGVGALVLPAVAQRFGFAAMYGVLAAVCAVAAALCWAWVHEPPSTSSGEPASAPAAVAHRNPLRDSKVWRIAAGIGILCAPQSAVLSFGTVFLHDFVHTGLLTTTVTMVSVQVGAMGMRVWSGRWTDRRRNRPGFMRACTALCIVLFAAMAAFSWWGAAADAGHGGALRIALVILLGATGICVSAWHGVAYTELATLVGPSRAGTALGMANTSVFIFMFLAPVLVPRLLALQGWPWVWLAGSACALVALPLLAPKAAPPAPTPADASLCRSA